VDWCRLPVIHFMEKRLLKFYVLQTLRVLPKLTRYDLVISHGAQSGVLLAFFQAVRGRESPPHAIIDVGSFNGARDRVAELALLRFALRSVSCVVYHARSQLSYYRRCLPLVADRSRFVYFGTDPEFFRPAGTPDRGYLICVGYKRRDWRTLVDAYSMARVAAPLLLVGKRRLPRLRLPPGVRTMGFVPIQRLNALVEGARLAVLPLPALNFSYGQMTLLQAMALSKPVVVSRVPGIEDYVDDGQTALFAKPGDPSDMADKLARFLGDPQFARVTGERARRAVLERFNERKMAQAIYEAIMECCGL